MLNYPQRRIESVIYSPDGDEPPFLKALLYGISQIYGGVQVLRRICYRKNWLPSFRLPCKVISVGNLAVGGTGKTPMASYLARTLHQMGQRVAVISRGYKGKGVRNGHVVSDGQRVLMDTQQSGDEAQLLARRLLPIPVLIGKNRYRTGMAAVRQFQPEVIILDDGFQHIRLQRDLDLVLLDDAAPLGNGCLLPRGLLREPATALNAADGIIFTRSGPLRSTDPKHPDFLPSQIPIFRSVHKPYHFILRSGETGRDTNQPDPALCRDLNRLDGSSVAVFSGIARNDDFQRTLMENGARLAAVHSFSDHHPYAVAELNRIAAESRHTGADLLVTTEKDFMRLPPDFVWPLDLMVVGVEIDFGKQDNAFREFLQAALKRLYRIL